MSCDEIVELMQRDMDNDLSPFEGKLLEQHVKQCSECSSFYHRLKLLSEGLENLPKVMPPFSIVDSILPTLQAIDRPEAASEVQTITPVRPKFWTRSRIAAGAVAASMLIGVYIINDYVLPTSNDMALSEGGSMPVQSNSDAQAPQESTLITSPISPDVAIQQEQNDDSKDTSVGMSAFGEKPVVKQEVVPNSGHNTGQSVKEESTAANVSNERSSTASNETSETTKSTVPADQSDPASDSNNAKTSEDIPAIEEGAVAQEEFQDESAAASITSVDKADTGGKYGITAEPEAETASEQKRRTYGLFSPDDRFLATVIDRMIVIENNEGQALFKSHVLPEQFEMRMKWQSETMLVYELYDVNLASSRTSTPVETWSVEMASEIVTETKQ